MRFLYSNKFVLKFNYSLNLYQGIKFDINAEKLVFFLSLKIRFQFIIIFDLMRAFIFFNKIIFTMFKKNIVKISLLLNIILIILYYMIK